MYDDPAAFPSTKVCDLVSVREYGEQGPVELWWHCNGRLVIRAYNERLNNVTEVDLWDLLNWLQAGQINGCWILRLPRNLMDSIVEEIERALKARLYYLAIMLTLALPDICAALESANGRSTSKKYKAWYNRYWQKMFPNLTADDCYSLRCGVVHQGAFGLDSTQYSRMIFALPDSHGLPQIEECQFMGAYVYSVLNFCDKATLAVRAWYTDKKDNPVVMTNLPRLIQVHPEGLAPFVIGIPVLA